VRPPLQREAGAAQAQPKPKPEARPARPPLQREAGAAQAQPKLEAEAAQVQQQRTVEPAPLRPGGERCSQC
jgi:hypothetical protein